MSAQVLPITTKQTHSAHRLGDSLDRLGRCLAWLADFEIDAVAFNGSTLAEPIVVVLLHPRSRLCFHDEPREISRNRIGSFIVRLWEGRDAVNRVRVRWQEVSPCA